MLYEHFRKSGRRGAEDCGIDCLSEIFIMQGRIRLQGVYRHWNWDEGSDTTDWMGKESKSARRRRSKGRGLSINTGERESYKELVHMGWSEGVLLQWKWVSEARSLLGRNMTWLWTWRSPWMMAGYGVEGKA